MNKVNLPYAQLVWSFAILWRFELLALDGGASGKRLKTPQKFILRLKR